MKGFDQSRYHIKKLRLLKKIRIVKVDFQKKHMEEWTRPQELNAKIPMICNSVAGEDVSEFHGEHGVQISKAWRKSTLTIHGRTDAVHEEPIYWPPEAKSKVTEKKTDAEKDWGQEEKGMREGEMAAKHHWLKDHVFEKTLGDLKGMWAQSSCCTVTKNQTRLSDWTHQKIVIGSAWEMVQITRQLCPCT